MPKERDAAIVSIKIVSTFPCVHICSFFCWSIAFFPFSLPLYWQSFSTGLPRDSLEDSKQSRGNTQIILWCLSKWTTMIHGQARRIQPNIEIQDSHAKKGLSKKGQQEDWAQILVAGYSLQWPYPSQEWKMSAVHKCIEESPDTLGGILPNGKLQ